MDWNTLIEKYDKQKMLRYMRSFPKNLLEGAFFGKQFKAQKNKKIANIALCGMGGSGIGGAVLKNLVKKEIKIPIETVNDYELPAFIGKNSLVVAVSYSGNTEETISCLKEAKKKKATTIAITTGGMIAKKYKKCPWCLVVPNAFPKPRLGFSYLFTPLLMIFGEMGLIKKKDRELNEAIHSLEKHRHKIETTAINLAIALQNKIPAIYAQAEFATIGYRFCTELNENSKQFCHSQVFPEMNHNEIVALHGADKIVFVLLRDKKERKRIAQRFEIYKQLWKKKFKIIEIFVEGNSLLSRTLYAVWLESLTSFYLAMLNHENPTDNPLIETLKTELKEKKG